MNSNQKSFKPVVAQLKTGKLMQSIKRPVAPPVYRPTTTANTAQPRMANGTVNRKLPVAPPVFRLPVVPRVLQTKTSSQAAKLVNLIRPVTAKTTASRFSAVQMAKAAEKKAHECSAKVIASSGAEFTGDYAVIHAEINALEAYFESGGDVAGIATIQISSPPCKYCYVILSDLGLLAKVDTGGKKGFGRCQGGSYGWFKRGGSVWKAIKAVYKFKGDEDAYASSVCERKPK